MHRLLSLVKEETDESLRLIATHYARDFEFSHFAGRNFVFNSDLLAKSLSQDPNVLLVLATGVEAYDTIKRKPVEISNADPLTCIIQLKTGKSL